MDETLKNKIKDELKANIRKFFKDKDKTSYQVLNHIFPAERRIRSLIGGLETSLGKQFWEPIAKILAELNGFEIISEPLLIPEPFPKTLRDELNSLINQRERNVISTLDCIARLRRAAAESNFENVNFVPPQSGTGVDIYLKKDNIEYLFDIKTAQPNQGLLNSFNGQLLRWYSYRFAHDSTCHVQARIIIPFNPYKKDWYVYNKSKLNESHLDRNNDLWVGNEFWDFCSGFENTLEHLQDVFIDLGKENFAQEFHDIFYDPSKIADIRDRKDRLDTPESVKRKTKKTE
ncbi:TdeIII family type II restriction endonuclease [Pannus brasiliensis CCIBt3594]|uniref:type II site-specific deoxyribonuclease n=1 Tax=Pannus brasiliensis CCIBt3594 TaxID=1427578 RepID=A0AAW9QNQ3_9CHRO